jgi:peptidoglycan/xylan/chitin deacetylase (PgdA/CDA1 family)
MHSLQFTSPRSHPPNNHRTTTFTVLNVLLPHVIVLQINPFSNKVVRAITDPHVNSNGCNVPATWYALQTGSECATVKTLWQQNHEIALHTVNHVPLVTPFTGDLKNEMLGVRNWLNTTCGIPLEEMIGFRHPYLVNNPATRRVLSDAGLVYDSTMIENFPSESSPAAGQRVWPFTMDAGIPVNCEWNAPDGKCSQQNESYPGLWEVPMWELQDSTGTHIATMDPEGDVYNLLLDNFNMNYNGNKAPFGIFIHAPWFDDVSSHCLSVAWSLIWAVGRAW